MAEKAIAAAGLDTSDGNSFMLLLDLGKTLGISNTHLAITSHLNEAKWELFRINNNIVNVYG
jgi:hypothetical protein